MRADEREVARIDYATLAEVYAGRWTTGPQLVAAADRWPATDQDVLIETPTLSVRVRGHDEDWLLWGVAGHMVNEMRLRYPRPPSCWSGAAAPPSDPALLRESLVPSLVYKQ